MQLVGRGAAAVAAWRIEEGVRSVLVAGVAREQYSERLR